MLFTRNGFAAQVTLAWDPNTEVHLAGYRIYYKTSTPGAPYDGTGANEGDSPIDVPLALLTDEDNPEYTVTGLSDTKTYYFAVTAYSHDKRESGYSGEVSTGSTPSAASTGGSGGGGGGGCLIATAGSGLRWNGSKAISDLSFGLPPFGRVPSFGFRISDLRARSWNRNSATEVGPNYILGMYQEKSQK